MSFVYEIIDCLGWSNVGWIKVTGFVLDGALSMRLMIAWSEATPFFKFGGASEVNCHC
jgi:hypothetical protein